MKACYLGVVASIFLSGCGSDPPDLSRFQTGEEAVVFDEKDGSIHPKTVDYHAGFLRAGFVPINVGSRVVVVLDDQESEEPTERRVKASVKGGEFDGTAVLIPRKNLRPVPR